MFQRETQSFNASKEVRLGDSWLITINTITCFLRKIGENYSSKRNEMTNMKDQSLQKQL